MNTKDFKPGQRVQAHPATDRWMKGQRFGTVEMIGKRTVWVRFDRGSRKVASVQARNLLPVEE